MRKWSLFLIIISVVWASYKITPVLAESEKDKDAVAIKQVIENYWKGFISGDLDLTMSQISTNYSSFIEGVNEEGKVADYTNFKLFLEKNLKKFINISINDLKITNLDIQNNNASVEMEYTFKAFIPEFSKDVSKKNRRSFSLTKEGASWKIVQCSSPL